MTPPTLWESVTENRLGPSRHGQPSTARAAAESNAPRSGTQRGKVLLILARAGDFGATDFELAEAAGIVRPHVAGTRRKELADRGFVEATDRRRQTDTGSSAVVWRITVKGLEAVAEMRAVA